MSETLEILIRYRLEQADESLESAQILLNSKKYRPSVSRSYYAMFYAVLALLVKEGLRISKHTGAIAIFNKEFVKKGIFAKELSSWLQEALACQVVGRGDILSGFRHSAKNRGGPFVRTNDALTLCA